MRVSQLVDAALLASFFEMTGMVVQMVIDKTRDKKVAVVVAAVVAVKQRNPRLFAGCLQCVSAQLSCQKIIGFALIHKQFLGGRATGNQRAGIVLLPTVAILT